VGSRNSKQVIKTSLLEDGPLRRILRERGVLISPQERRPEDIVHRWREKGIPQPAIDMAMKMADKWLKAILK